MYTPGEYVVCRSGGVWQVKEARGGEYLLKRHEQETEKIVSVHSDEIVRPITSRKEILEAVSRIGFIPTLQAPNDKLRHALYRECMAKFDEIEWIRVIKTAYLRQPEKRLTSLEQEWSEQARQYFHGELSVLLEIPMEEVERYIASAVASDNW